MYIFLTMLLHRLLFIPAFLLSTLLLAQENVNYGNGFPATDALGRKLVTSKEAGLPRGEKFVGLFYWTWHTHFSGNKANDISKILRQKPEAINNYDDPVWPKDAPAFFWGEPLFGYYRDTDHWVLRKHAEMLADAGVDVIIFDCTNGSFTWKESYTELCKVFSEARNDGVNTPKIAFMLAFQASQDSRKAIGEIYNDLYKPGKYKDLWFFWKGKPLIMAYPEMLGEASGDDQTTKENKEIREFFTFRPGQPVYNKGPERSDHWGWLEIAPQHGFAKDSRGKFEQATVGVAQNWSAERGLTAMNAPNTFGRSYTHARGMIKDLNAADWGYNFQEQWENALKIDPEFIFITGWNEWIAGRFSEWNQQKNAFPDQFSREKSRDIEPVKGGFGDNYYYQMVNNIRRFKGVPALPKNALNRSVKVDGDFGDWLNVPGFSAYSGNTKPRNSHGWGNLVYTNYSGRNDIAKVKVTHDRSAIYFYIETAAPISPSSDQGWMRLFIDTDRNKNTGWEGYDYVVNRINPDNGKLILEKNRKGWRWKESGRLDYALHDNKMEIRIPGKYLKIKGKCRFEFKWADNQLNDGDIMDFYLNGDVSPLGRFNYIYAE